MAIPDSQNPGQDHDRSNGFYGSAVGTRWIRKPQLQGDEHEDDGRFNPKPKPRKELRVSEVAKDSTAARFTPDDWSRMAKALELDAGGMLFQVVKGLVASMSDSEIEFALDISHGTMRRYMQRLFKHFQARCRGEIAMKAVEAMRQPPEG